MAASSQSQSSSVPESDANILANALQDLARGERTAAALENQLTSLEAKIEALLAKADSVRAADDDAEVDEVDLEARLGKQHKVTKEEDESGGDESAKGVEKEADEGTMAQVEQHDGDTQRETINGTSIKERT